MNAHAGHAPTRREALRLLTMTRDQAVAADQLQQWEHAWAARRRALATVRAQTPRRWHARLDDVLAELHPSGQAA